MSRLPVFSFNDVVTATGVPASQATPQLLVRPPKHVTLQVKGVGAAPTAWKAAVERSLDGVNFDENNPVLTHDSAGTPADKDGDVKSTGANFVPGFYYRTRLISVTLGTATGVQIIAQGA